MGMTIDESIRVISYVKPKKPTSPSGMLKKNAFNTAIDTMRKYQKIQNIAENYDKGILEENDGVYAFKQIRKVLEDGNNT